MASIDSQINRFLNKYPDNIPDIGKVEYNRCGSRMEVLIPIGEIFCDNLIFHCPCNHFSTTNGRSPEARTYIAIIRERLGDLNDIENIKPIYAGLDKKYNVIPSHIHELKEKKTKTIEEYEHGYISLKVSLIDVPIRDVINVLQEKTKGLENEFVYLESIDVTQDQLGNITREEVKVWINEEFPEVSIVNDERKVGRNCLSWITTDGVIRIRCKVYNKFVQMAESPSIRSSLGSLLPSLVVNKSESFRRKLANARDYGLTRLECTIYSREIRDCEYYIAALEEARGMIKGCPVYMTSFEKQWVELADKIASSSSTCAVYDYKRSIFAYCHWYNSVTGKKQGYAKENVEESDIPWLLAAYSFNNVPIHYIRFSANENGEYVVESEADYMREGNSTEITLVPGVQKSLYPSLKVIADDRQFLQFRDVGIVEHKGINVGWPKNRINKRSKPLAVMVQVNNENISLDLKELIITNTALYKPGHNVLVPNEAYKITSIGRKDFRRKPSIFVILENDNNEMSVKAGPSLERVIIENEPKRKQFMIRTGNTYRLENGSRDIEVNLKINA